MALINNKPWENFKLEKILKNLDAFQAETLTRGRQRRFSRRKAGPLGGLRGVPVLAETPARSAVVVLEAAKTPKRGSPDGERTEGRTPF